MNHTKETLMKLSAKKFPITIAGQPTSMSFRKLTVRELAQDHPTPIAKVVHWIAATIIGEDNKPVMTPDEVYSLQPSIFNDLNEQFVKVNGLTDAADISIKKP